MASFADAYDLQERLQATFSADEWVAAEDVLRGATATIRSEAANQQIELVTNDLATLRGNWTNRLWLPQLPVVAIHSIVIKNGSVFVDELPLHFNSDYRWDRLGLVRRVSYVTGRLLAPASGFWGGDMAIVEVDYDHGYAVIPDDLRDVCLSLAMRRFLNPTGIHAETIETYTVKNEPTSSAPMASIGLSDEEKRVVANYRGTRRRVGTLQT